MSLFTFEIDQISNYLVCNQNLNYQSNYVIVTINAEQSESQYEMC